MSCTSFFGREYEARISGMASAVESKEFSVRSRVYKFVRQAQKLSPKRSLVQAKIYRTLKPILKMGKPETIIFEMPVEKKSQTKHFETYRTVKTPPEMRMYVAIRAIYSALAAVRDLGRS